MLLAALTTLVLAGSACGTGESDTTVSDPGSSPSSSPTPSPSSTPSSSAPATPVPAGPVGTRGLATVMDEGTGAVELCLGPIAESYPPQCSGPPIAGWHWAEHRGYDEQGKIRWGSYALTGTWDGTTFTATDAVSGALYDPAAPLPSPTPAAATTYADTELASIADELRDTLPGYLGASGGDGTDGHVLADVYYDDGSLQEWADATYGAHVVVISPALVDR
jgi:hypothetical protein